MMAEQNAALVTTPLDMAHVLMDSSALSAAAYALAAHETACEAGDDQRSAFWQGVCDELLTMRTLVAYLERKVA